MQEYAESQVCRRRILLNYFGETSDCSCGNCDVCKNPPQHFDGTIIVQKALSAIKRADEQAGFTLVTDILKGSMSPAVVAKGLHTLKTFGAGRDITAGDWHAYLLQMLQRGYIEIAYNEDSHIKLTSLGEDVLFGRKHAELAVIVREDLRVTKRKRQEQLPDSSDQMQTADQQLFEKLRELRLTIAHEIKKPAYIVLSDKSLQSLAMMKPTNLFLLGNCFGIGEHKKNQYGDRFVELICRHLGVERSPEPFEPIEDLPFPDAIDAPIENRNSKNVLSNMHQQKELHANAYTPWSDEEDSTLRFLHRQGKTIKELALILQRNEGSISSRLRKMGII